MPNLDSLRDPALQQALWEAIPGAIVFLDLSGNVRSWDGKASELFAWSADETIGKPFPALRLSLLGEALESRLQCEPQRTFVRKCHRKDGTEIQTMWSGAVVRGPDGAPDGIVEFITDVSRLMELEDQFRTEGRFRQLLEAAPDAILEVDASGRIVLLNAVAERAFGYTREELVNQPIEVLVPEAVRGRHASNRTDYTAAPVVRPMGSGLHLRARRKDGSTFPVEISLSPVQYEGERRITAIIRDISDRWEAEQRIREIQERHNQELALANAELALRNREVERANRLKSEFLASMSHELRTPLHTIIGFSELLGEQASSVLSAKQKRFVDHIHRDSLHLLELINDILDLSKIEAGRLELRREVFALEPALDEVLASIRPLAAVKTLSLGKRLVDEISVDADRVRLKEIFFNLLSNAVKFTPEGGSIEVTAALRNGLAEIAVIDTGIGVAPEEHAAIFDTFYQSGSTTKGVKEGTGLGLTITRKLVEMHGGTIWLESKPGGGSRFTFTIPAAEESPDALPEPRVLVIDDELAARELLSGFLEPQGFPVAVAATRDEGVALAAKLQPSVIILDLVMASKGGLQALRELKLNPRTSSIPVMILSVLDESQSAFELGAAAYLNKPVNLDELLQTVQRLCGAGRKS